LFVCFVFKGEELEFFVNSNFAFPLKSKENNTYPTNPHSEFYLTQPLTNIEITAAYNQQHEKSLLTTHTVKSGLDAFTHDSLQIQSYLIDNYYSIMQPSIRIAFISKRPLIAKPSVCAIVFAYEDGNDNFLFKTCSFTYDTSANAMCLTVLNLNADAQFIKAKKNLNLFYKFKQLNEHDCLHLNQSHIHNLFSHEIPVLTRFDEVLYLEPIDYNRKYSNLIIISPQIPFNIYIPKIEYRIDNRFFIYCELNYENLATKFDFFNARHDFFVILFYFKLYKLGF
jgi:hypothetical protein